MSRFVAPQLNLLPISNGDTLTVKRRLNRGEQAEMFTRMRAPDGTQQDSLVGLAGVLAYLVDWSLVDDAGALVPYRDLDQAARAQTLNSLDPDDFAEIRDAIAAHVTAIREAREAEKKTLSGAPASSAISSSPAGVTGASSGSTRSTPTSTTSLSPSSPVRMPALTSPN